MSTPDYKRGFDDGEKGARADSLALEYAAGYAAGEMWREFNDDQKAVAGLVAAEMGKEG
jgi:hypothetical protein